MLLVVDEHVVNDDAVEESNVNTPHTNLRAKFFRERRSNFGTDKTLHLGYMSERGKQHVNAQDCPHRSADNSSKFLDTLSILRQN